MDTGEGKELFADWLEKEGIYMSAKPKEEINNTPNMGLWNVWCKPPEDALKKIGGGRLKGFSDINPQWRIEALTSVFGPCGIGWRYDVTRVEFLDGASGEKLVHVYLSLFLKRPEGTWTDAIVGVGGDTIVEKESSGLRTNDEGLKSAVTDALGNACKYLGIGADVYRGRLDTKYGRKDAPAVQYQSNGRSPPPGTTELADGVPRDEQGRAVELGVSGRPSPKPWGKGRFAK